MHPDEIELLKLQNENMETALRMLLGEMARTGMSDYNPNPTECLELSKWVYGLLELLGLNDK